MSTELRKAVNSGPQESWTILGTCSDGGPFVSRCRVGGPELLPLRTSEDVRRYQENRVARMNALGANVRLVHQRIGDDLLWHEVTGG